LTDLRTTQYSLRSRDTTIRPRRNAIGREPVPKTYAEIENCSKEIAVKVRRASTIINTLVNRLRSYGPEVSRKKQKLQLETYASLSRKFCRFRVDAKLYLPTLSVGVLLLMCLFTQIK